MKEPKNGRLTLALKLVDDLVALGHQSSELIRQIEELYPHDPEFNDIKTTLDTERSVQVARLRVVIASKHHR